MKGTPSPVYREGVWMVWREEIGGLLQNGEWLEACSRLDLGRQVWLLSDLACNSDHFSWVLGIDLEKTKDLVWPAMDFTFCYFGQNLILHMGLGFAI